MQHKILKFCREILNDALDRELVQKNVADVYKRQKLETLGVKIDTLTEEQIAYMNSWNF